MDPQIVRRWRRQRKPTVDIPDDVPTGLNGDDHFAYIVGYPNGNVEPNGNITRAEVATIFFRLLTEEVRTANSTQSNSLSDVTRGQWFNHAVSTLSSMGIVKGHNDGTFAPNADHPCGICRNRRLSLTIRTRICPRSSRISHLTGKRNGSVSPQTRGLDQRLSGWHVPSEPVYSPAQRR